MQRSALICAALALLAGRAAAFDPPADTSGPLTVRLSGPSEVTRAGAVLPVSVILDNQAEVNLSGTLEMKTIDSWRADPAAALPFSVEPHSRTSLSFAVTVGQASYSAYYPIHAFARFAWKGAPHTAHAVLMVDARLPNPPTSRPSLDWKPMPVPQNGGLGIWRLPVYRTATHVVVEPMLRSGGGLQTRPGGEVVEMGVPVVRGGQQREAIVMRLGMRPPSYQEHVDSISTEFAFKMPRSGRIRMRFALSVDDDAKVPVLFRVRAIRFDAPFERPGFVMFERRTATHRWEEAEVDLTHFSGEAVRVQLEVQSPTANHTVYWAEPTVTVGRPPQLAPPPPGPRFATWQPLGILETEGKKYDVRVSLGKRGLLDGAVVFADSNRALGFEGFQVKVLGDNLGDWRSLNQFVELKTEKVNGLLRIHHRFRALQGPFDLVAELTAKNGALRVQFKLDSTAAPVPWAPMYIENIALGRWSERPTRIYAGQGNVLDRPEAFELPFGGHTLASSYVGFEFPGAFSVLEGVDIPPGRLRVDPPTLVYTLDTPNNQTITLIPCPGVWSGVKVWRGVWGRSAPAGVPQLAGRFVFDLWHGRYAETADALEKAFRYGLTDALVIWHNWQRWKYDYRLPDIYPPNPEYGSLQDFRRLVDVCRKNGVLFAPHDNYIDFYPDAEGFSYDSVALNSEGKPQTAWIAENRYSYRFRPDKLAPFLERNLKAVKEGFAPSAYFLDVWSSESPYDYYTQEGRFFDRVSTRQVWAEGFAWIREFLGQNAPQISEAGHDQLTGYLDGATAVHERVDPDPSLGFVWHIKAADAERVPWLDAAYHDTFVLHGAGYPGRYDSGLDPHKHGIYSDDYISTEVLTGHPGMAPAAFDRDVVRKYWLLHGLMRGLALRTLEGVEFADGSLHRQHVRWSQDGETWVNRSSEAWNVEGHMLPPYGFYARVPVKGGVIEAAIEQRGEGLVEWTSSPQEVYVNVRSGKAVSLRGVRTAGAFRMSREKDGVRLTVLPSSSRSSVHLRWPELPFKTDAPVEAEALDETGRVLWREPLTTENGEIVLALHPDATAYRFQ